MQETVSVSAAIQDDLPTPRSEAATWWEDHLRPLVDFKSFLRQRKTILTNHEVIRSTQPPYEGWKNPFAFALSATTLTFTVVALIGLTFHTLLPDPDLKHDWIARTLQSDLRTVDTRLAHAQGASRSRLIQERDQINADINDHVAGFTVPHEGLVLTAGAPLVVYFLGVLFPRFIRKSAASAPHAASARAAIYYYFTARTFWPAFLLVTGGALYFFMMKYSLYNTYDEVPQSLAGTGPFHLILSAVLVIATIALIYAFIATPILFHKCACEISTILGITTDKHARHAVYWGLIRTVTTASVLAFTLGIFLAAGYAAYDGGSQQVRTEAGAALSIAPASAPSP